MHEFAVDPKSLGRKWEVAEYKMRENDQLDWRAVATNVRARERYG